MSDESEVRIEARPNGPLVVKGLDSLRGPDGQALDVKAVVALCRCGGSKTKPFCDGSHKTNGFDSSSGGEPEGKDAVRDYAGSEVTVTFNARLCAHAGECGRLAPEVFDTRSRPWIQPDKGSRTAAENAVAHCPSGALALRTEEGIVHLFAPERARIEVQRNGPYFVHDAALDAAAPGEGASPRKYVLCRCGKSGNKPYCDGTHQGAGWQSGD